jgi:hypothetical protein
MVHRAKMGYQCGHRWTLPALAYTVFTNDDLKSRFGNSRHDTLGVAKASEADVAAWLEAEVARNDVPNIFKVAEFVMDLRGMPRPCATLTLA